VLLEKIISLENRTVSFNVLRLGFSLVRGHTSHRGSMVQEDEQDDRSYIDSHHGEHGE
jgi:hypothetical protein